jgi:hypothetical protein
MMARSLSVLFGNRPTLTSVKPLSSQIGRNASEQIPVLRPVDRFLKQNWRSRLALRI